MKNRLQSVVLWLALLGILASAVGCVNVKAPAKSESDEQMEALGGSNGYVLLKHSNGKFYVVNLENHNAQEVDGLPPGSTTLTVY